MRREPGAGSTQHSGERRSRSNVHEAHSTALVGRLESERGALEAGPSTRRRPSIARHPAPNSHPPVPTLQAASGHFSRSRSNSNSVMSPESFTPEPSSWPRSMQHPTGPRRRSDGAPLPLSPISRIPPGPYTPGTQSSGGSVGRGHFSPAVTSPSRLVAPSTVSLPLMSPHHYRNMSDEFDMSPTDNASWHYPSPRPPHTPLSLRGASIPPPSVLSEESPYMGMLSGDFSPFVGPTGAFPMSRL